MIYLSKMVIFQFATLNNQTVTSSSQSKTWKTKPKCQMPAIRQSKKRLRANKAHASDVQGWHP